MISCIDSIVESIRPDIDCAFARRAEEPLGNRLVIQARSIFSPVSAWARWSWISRAIRVHSSSRTDCR